MVKHMGRGHLFKNNFAMMSMCKCKGLVHHLRSQIYILTLQQQSQQTHTLCDGGWVSRFLGRDVASGADRHLDITFIWIEVVEISYLVSVLFREAFSHPYISFFHLVVNGFCVTSFRTFLKTPYLPYIGGRGGIKMASASAPSANEPAKTSL